MAAFATAGRRGLDRMEDRHVVAQELGAHKNVHLVGVFDGHRGAEAAEFARTQVGSTTMHLRLPTLLLPNLLSRARCRRPR